MAEHKRCQAYIYQAQLVKSEIFWTPFPPTYSMVPNNRAARLIWHYITVHKNTYTLINFQGFCPTYTVIWTPRLFGTLE